MLTIEEQKNQRRVKFWRWWNRNNKNVRAHEWLVRQAKKDAYSYNFHPNAFSMISEIGKRFHNSEYKRLTMDDCWFLWKHTHLIMDERIQRLKESGDYYTKARKSKKEEVKKEKGFTVETKKKRVFKR